MSMSHQYTFQKARIHLAVTPEMEKLALGKKELTASEYGSLLTWQCQKLTSILDDQDFLDALQEVASQQKKPESRKALRDFFVDAELFADYIRKEEKILLEAGASRDFTNASLAKQALARQRYLDSQPQVAVVFPAGEVVIKVFQDMKTEICRAESGLRSHLDNLEKQRISSKKENIWLSVGTATANAAALIPSGLVSGLSTFFSLLFAMQVAD